MKHTITYIRMIVKYIKSIIENINIILCKNIIKLREKLGGGGAFAFTEVYDETPYNIYSTVYVPSLRYEMYDVTHKHTCICRAMPFT
jgi:hypothetical protein